MTAVVQSKAKPASKPAKPAKPKKAAAAPTGPVDKVLHYKDILKCNHGGTVDLDPTEERNTEIKDDLRVVTDKDLLEKVTLKGCSIHCTKIVKINVGLARDVELTGGAIPVLGNLVATTDKGCTVKWADSGYSIDKAVATLDKNAHEHSTHYCAQYVQNAIRAGGLTNLPGANATDFGPVLSNNGFSPVATNASSGFSPQTGDVVVFPAVGTHEFGHTAMWDGHQWVSDFRQNNMAVWGDQPHPRYTIYRKADTSGAKANGNQAHAGPK